MCVRVHISVYVIERKEYNLNIIEGTFVRRMSTARFENVKKKILI